MKGHITPRIVLKQGILNRIKKCIWTYAILVITLFCGGELSSQTRPGIFLEDLEESSLNVRCLCNPGIRNKSRSKGIELTYNLVGPGDVRAARSIFTEPYPRYSKFRKFRVKVAAPIIRREAFKILVGYSYHAEQFEFQRLPNDFQDILNQFNNLNLKSSAFDLTFSYSLNEVNYMGIRINSRFSGDYDGMVQFDGRYSIFSGAIAFGIKKHEDNEWGFGLAMANNFRSSGLRALPFVFWNKNFNYKWGLEATFPSKFYMRYNFNPKTIMLGGFNYNGESYSFDQDLINRQVSFNHSELQFLLKFERQIVPWIWLDFVGGYQVNFDSNFELQANKRDLLSISPQNSWYLRFGIFISPPDEFLQRS